MLKLHLKIQALVVLSNSMQHESLSNLTETDVLTEMCCYREDDIAEMQMWRSIGS
jgi:hypothetical protein